MNIRIDFAFQKERIPVDYRSFILSFIKHSLEEYNENLYLKYYENDNPVMKTYTFSAFLGRAIFEKQGILLKDKKIVLHISDYDLQNALHLYNAFMVQYDKQKQFPVLENSFVITNIHYTLEKENEEDSIIVKMLSPLLVRHHQKGEKDIYYTFDDVEFKEELKTNIQNMIHHFGLPFTMENFDIVPIKNKKTVIQLYHSYKNASLGIFQIKGDPELLDFLTKAGMGSLRSSGFGHFKIIG